MLHQTLIPELKQEGAQTRKMLERVPYERFDWKPHDKSMLLRRLSVHIAELPGWIPLTLQTTELDLAQRKYEPTAVGSTEALLALHDKKLEEAVTALSSASDEDLMMPWTLRMGDRVMFTMPRIAVIRTITLNHIIHHRAQLSVYLRLLDVPVPGMYGPSADEMLG